MIFVAASVNILNTENLKKANVLDSVNDISNTSEKAAYFTLAIFIGILFTASLMGTFLFLKNKMLSKRLEDHTATLSIIFKSIPELLFCKDMNGAYTSCNSGFELFAGLKESETLKAF